jgi:hypothetical protein
VVLFNSIESCTVGLGLAGDNRVRLGVAKTITIGTLLALGIEYGLCVLVAHFQGYENVYEQGGIYLAVIWAVQIALWFKNSVVGNIYYWVWAKNRAATEIGDQFSKLQFPAFTEWDSVEDWLGGIMYNDELSHDAKLYAALLEGQIVMARGIGLQALFRMVGIIKLAAKKHTNRLPSPNP